MASSLGPLVAASFGVVAIKAATDAYIKQEQAVFQLEQRIKSTGGAAGKTTAELQATAAALQKITVFGDEATMELQALLLTFTQIRGDQFDEATIAIQNVASAMGTDLKSAALQVGKALNDPAGQLSALSRSGIQFTKDQKGMIKEMVKLGDVAGAQTVILKELENQFGGAAGVHGLGGALKQFGNTFGDTLEIIGGSGTGFIALIKEANIGLTSFNEYLDEIEGSAAADALSGMAIGFGTIREAIEGIPDLPEWLKSGGSDALQQALPLWLNAAIQVGKASREAQEVLGGVTFPAPQAPSGFIADGTALGAKPTGTSGDEDKKGAIDALGDPMYGIDGWLMLHDEAVEVKAVKQLEAYELLAALALEDDERRAIMMEERIDAERRGLDIIHEMTITDADRRVEAERAADANILASKQAVLQGTVGLLQLMGNKHKAAAYAAIALAKGVRIGENIMATLVAQMHAMAQLGPIAGPPVAASIGAWGAANTALIAATGIAQASQVGGGGSGGSVSGAGTVASPVITQPTPQDQATEQPRTISITVMGNIIDQDKFAREFIPSLAKAINDGHSLEYA